jgi:hypothetical protein
MLVIDIPPNSNCEEVSLRVFHDLTPPQRVSGVRLARQAGEVRWHDVTGWTTAGMPCPAMMQKVDDSGEGVAFLIYGGDAGLRLQPAGRTTPWRLEEPGQWGAPFLLLPGPDDLRFAAQQR